MPPACYCQTIGPEHLALVTEVRALSTNKPRSTRLYTLPTNLCATVVPIGRLARPAPTSDEWGLITRRLTPSHHLGSASEKSDTTKLWYLILRHSGACQHTLVICYDSEPGMSAEADCSVDVSEWEAGD